MLDRNNDAGALGFICHARSRCQEVVLGLGTYKTDFESTEDRKFDLGARLESKVRNV